MRRGLSDSSWARPPRHLRKVSLAERMRIFVIKAAIALYWGYVDATVFASSGRFATMQTGNFIRLGDEISRRKGESGGFTLAIIACCFAGSAAFKWGWRREYRRVVVVRVMACALVVLAAAADVLLVWGPGHTFNLPMSVAGGLFASGYFASVTHGVENLPTGPVSFLASFLAMGRRTPEDVETAATSLVIISVYTCGAAAGSLWARAAYTMPLFTLTTAAVACLVLLHYRSSVRLVRATSCRVAPTRCEDETKDAAAPRHRPSGGPAPVRMVPQAPPPTPAGTEDGSTQHTRVDSSSDLLREVEDGSRRSGDRGSEDASPS